MSCYHRHGHGCDWPVLLPDDYGVRGTYDYRPRRYGDDLVVVREDACDDELRPRRLGGSGRGRRCRDEQGREITTASLQSRADSLRDELARIEGDLARLADGDDTAAD